MDTTCDLFTDKDYLNNAIKSDHAPIKKSFSPSVGLKYENVHD